MRKFSKMFAFVLAAAMVFTAFAPAAKADAAKGMEINKQGKILYLTDGTGINDDAQVGEPGDNKGNVSEYDFAVSYKPTNWKENYTFTWSSSDPKIITVGKAGLTKAVGVGTADVECLVSDKATDTPLFTLKNTITVKANADKVTISAVKLNGTVLEEEDLEDFTVEVNDVVDLDRTMWRDGKSTTKRTEGVATDYTKWVVTDEDGKEVEGVKVTQKNGKFEFTDAAAEGTYLLSCYTYQSEKYSDKIEESDPVKVVLVKNVQNTFEVDQTTTHAFDIYFDRAVESLNLKDVTVKRVNVSAATGKVSESKVNVKSVVLDPKDKTKATVTLYSQLGNAVNYNVYVAGIEEPKLLTASVGYPTDVVVTAKDAFEGSVLTTNKGAVLEAKFLDAAGIDVTKVDPTYKASFSLVEYSKTGSYTMSRNGDEYTLLIKKAGELVGVTAKLQKRDNTGKLVVDINQDFYFEAMDPEPIYVAGMADYSLNDFDSNGNQQSLQVKDKDLTLTVKIGTTNPAEENPVKYAAGDIIDAEGQPKVSFTALDPLVCNIDKNGKLIPYKAGTAAFDVNLTFLGSDGKTYNGSVAEPIATVWIVVDENSKFDEFNFDKDYVSVGSVTNFDKETFTVTVEDQYGKPLEDNVNAVVITGVSDNAKKAFERDANVIAQPAAGSKQTIEIYGAKLEAAVAGTDYAIAEGSSATFEFKAAYGTFEKTFSVTVQTPGTVDYAEVKGNGVADALRVSDKDETKALKELVFTVCKMNNGIQVGTQPFLTNFPTTEEAIANVQAGSYFYKLTKNGEAIKDASYVTVDAANGKVTVALSGSTAAVSGSAIGTGKTVNYDVTGEGLYKFELFYSWNDGEIVSFDEAEQYVTVGYAGAYAVAKQNEDSVRVVNNYVKKDGEVSNFEADKDAILACFTFTGRDNKEVDLTKATVDVIYDASPETGLVIVNNVVVYESLGVTDGVEYFVAYNITLDAVLARK